MVASSKYVQHCILKWIRNSSAVDLIHREDGEVVWMALSVTKTVLWLRLPDYHGCSGTLI